MDAYYKYVIAPKNSMVSRLKKEYKSLRHDYKKSKSIEAVARNYGISPQKVRRILITTGDYTNDTAKKIAVMQKQGLPVSEIAQELGITTKAVNSYLPYTKCEYNSVKPSQNALAIRKHRKINSKGDTNA